MLRFGSVNLTCKASPGAKPLASKVNWPSGGPYEGWIERITPPAGSVGTGGSLGVGLTVPCGTGIAVVVGEAGAGEPVGCATAVPVANGRAVALGGGGEEAGGERQENAI